MAVLMGAAGDMALYAILGVSVMLNIQFLSFEKRFPTIKAMRTATRKGMQLAMIHDPEGSAVAIPIKLVPGSNQLELDKLAEVYGIKFKPRGMNEAEFVDRKLAIFHYMGQFPHNLPVKGVVALSRVTRMLEARGVYITQEKLNTFMHRDLDAEPEEIRKTMVKGSENRIPDEELKKLGQIRRELQATKSNSTGPFVFGEAYNFLHYVGMSGTVSLREWKSYIITNARGELQPSHMMLDARSVGMIAIMLAIAYVISKAGTMGGALGGIKLG
jgi:hypothetical protein